MHAHRPMIQTMNISKIRGRFNEVVNQVYRRDTRVVIEKSGIPVAAIVSTEDLARLDRFDKERAERFAVIDAARVAFQDVPDEEIERETDRVLATSSSPQP